MLGIGEYSGRLSMVMRSSGHVSLEPTLEGPEYVLHHRLRLHNGSVLSSASHIILLTYHQHSMGPFGIYTEHQHSMGPFGIYTEHPLL
jgi:hypothetical protein